MENKVYFSVIMPVYNAGPYVEKAIKSVLAQSFHNIELICVDDCSSDNSFEIIKRLSETDKRIVAIHSDKNVGAGQARNIGIENAKGEYITFVDSDDIIDSDLYEKVYELIKNSDIDEAVWGLTEERYNLKNQLVKSIPISPKQNICNDQKDLTKAVLHLERDTLFGYQWNSIYKASLIFKYNVRFTDSLFYEDYFFNLEFIKYVKTLATLDYTGYHYYKRINGSITNRFSKDYFRLSYRRVETMFEFCKDRNQLNPEAYNILGNKLLRYTLSALSRNNNPLSEMNGNDRKNWFYDICRLPLYSEILPVCGKQNLLFKILKTSILKKRAFPALVIGKIVFLIKI